MFCFRQVSHANIQICVMNCEDEFNKEINSHLVIQNECKRSLQRGDCPKTVVIFCEHLCASLVRLRTNEYAMWNIRNSTIFEYIFDQSMLCMLDSRCVLSDQVNVMCSVV